MATLRAARVRLNSRICSPHLRARVQYSFRMRVVPQGLRGGHFIENLDRMIKVSSRSRRRSPASTKHLKCPDFPCTDDGEFHVGQTLVAQLSSGWCLLRPATYWITSKVFANRSLTCFACRRDLAGGGILQREQVLAAREMRAAAPSSEFTNPHGLSGPPHLLMP